MSSLVKSAEMDIRWGSLPLLPLRCVLEHLSTEDALAAMSTCQHWRTAILLYEGHKETLKLNARQLEKSLLLSRLFRKHTRKLHVYIDCGEEEFERFMNYVLPQFFDTVKLTQVLFIGPSYIVQNQSISVVKLKRIITESLVFKHLQSIEQLGLMGCAMDTAKNENDRYIHKHIEYYSKPLSFSSAPSAADRLLSSGNIGMMMFSGIQHIIMDYEQISTETLITLSHLSVFSHLSLNVTAKRQQRLAPLDWPRLSAHYPNGLDVSVNIINMPYIRFQDVIQNVLVEGLALVSLKVLFCKTIYEPLLTHVTRMYKESLREVVWADVPSLPSEASHRMLKRHSQRQDMSSANVNPFILLCWQCEQLRRLVIHGYWVQQYDVLGFVRLRKTLEHLEISSMYSDRGRVSNSIAESDLCRVLSVDAPRPVDKGFIEQVNEFTEFEWTPVSSKKLHPGLRGGSSAEQRTDYLVQEVSRSMGGSSYSL